MHYVIKGWGPRDHVDILLDVHMYINYGLALLSLGLVYIQMRSAIAKHQYTWASTMRYMFMYLSRHVYQNSDNFGCYHLHDKRTFPIYITNVWL